MWGPSSRSPFGRLAGLWARLRRVERRRLRDLRRWLETTSNLVHASVLVFVPLLVGAVTLVSGLTPQLSFLLYPPLASGTYTLFSDPRGKYASPWRFVGGLTLGALCGWLALALATRFVYPTAGSVGGLALAAALSVALTGAATWLLDLEEPPAFSTALLVLAASTSPAAYVLSVAVTAVVVAGVFAAWRERFYGRRSRFLYATTSADDRVLVPMRGHRPRAAAAFGARLAAAHEAGKLVLLDVVDDEATAVAERARLEDDADRAPVEGADAGAAGEGESGEAVAAEAAARLQRHAERVRATVDVPVQIAVGAGAPATTALEAARTANCDLIVAPDGGRSDGDGTAFVGRLFDGDVDAVAFRSADGRETWRRVLVAVARPGDGAHAMVDFAGRLAGDDGVVSVCTCIDSERQRRPAESRLADVVETAADVQPETRVARASVDEFLAANAGAYDLVLIGASGDRSTASRLVSPPTFRRLSDLPCDVAVVDCGR